VAGEDKLICGTRAVKWLALPNGSLLADLAPGVASKLHVAEHRAALQVVNPGLRKALADGSQFPPINGKVTAPLFKGQLVVANLKFDVAGKPVALGDDDIKCAIEYLKCAVPPISAYVGKYGECRLKVSPTHVDFPVKLADKSYNNDTLKSWVNQIYKSANVDGDVCVVVLNPPELVNVNANLNAPTAKVYGYHDMADVPYCFVNVSRGGLSVKDEDHAYAPALSHEVAEMTADPRADHSNPEVCDSCASNYQNPFFDYFDANGAYLDAKRADEPAPAGYAFFISAVTQPKFVTAMPAPASACRYPPPSGEA